MSKKEKWIVAISSILGLGGLAYLICLATITEQTKAFTEIAFGYLNTPYGLGCGISITGGAILYFLIKGFIKFGLENSKYGKHELGKLNDKVELAENKSLAYKEKAEKLDELVKASLSNFNDRIDYLADYLSKVCETSPNNKIKALGSELNGKYESKKQELKDNLGGIEKDLTKYTKKLATIEELESKYNELLGKVETYVKDKETIIYQAEEE